MHLNGVRSHAVTGVKKGKAYFTSWSMNVKIEGQNVDRHADGMTHNHGSTTGNTRLNRYIDTENSKDCKDLAEKKERKCAIDADENKDFQDAAKERNRKRRKNKKHAYKVREKT